MFVQIFMGSGLKKVSGVGCQVSAGKFKNCEFRNLGIEGILSF
jgi:hypothetical protein